MSVPRVFGVRHLSPGAARHLRDFLDVERPAAVLVEGPVDFTPLIPEIVAAGVRPPIALLAFTRALPVRTVLYPFAVYSPEYQALQWASENGVEARFVDLPSACMVALQEREAERDGSAGGASDDERPDGDLGPDGRHEDGGEAAGDEDDAGEGIPVVPDDTSGTPPAPSSCRPNVHAALAREAGMPDFETYWEQTFEQRRAPDGYRRAARAFGDGLRALDAEIASPDFAENLVREAHMRREILRCMSELDVPAERIVVVVGAFHASAVEHLDEPLDEGRLATLPAHETDLTVMPYTYFRLSSQSGYGAGNHAPAYFELMWEHLAGAGDLAGLAADYLSRVVRLQRESGAASSTAEVIEGVRLAGALASFRDAPRPALRDLRDAATTLLGQGRRAVVADALTRVEIGDRIGELPAGVRQTSIQKDFAEQLRRFKLERFRSPVQEALKLDLRENRRVQSEASAFLDLHRSFFLHRLQTLGIGFGRFDGADAGSDWIERWRLQWEPEREVELVEAVFLGDTIEQATGARFADRLADCTTIDGAAALVRVACLCGLPEMLDRARLGLQAMAAGSSDFVAIGASVARLGATLRYGDVRRLDLAPLRPLLADLYRQGGIRLVGACSVDEDGARRVAVAMGELHAGGDAHHELLDEGPWLESLREVARRDDLNAFLSGFAAALLLERDALDEASLATQLALRLSPGMPADLGAGWFEGLATRNRYGLLSRLGVWSHLARYVRDLPDEEFPRALVFLRRALGRFSPAEKRHVADNLGAIWQRQGATLSNALETPLTDAEQDVLDDLRDMDFEDL